MGKVNAWDVVKYVVQGIAEDISHKKQMAGVGKWNDMVPAKKKRDILPKKYPKKIQERFDEEEKAGIKRGPGAWGKK